ncbi:MULTISPECIES: hypothetical protein [Paenibacillus]|uniref:Uncharacterized protein n=1 Tax=Paenibacillus cucumis (ex Kampfer et al. 2016) TaxID=1776858 RepID=A0ABS7KKF2_9BACL|nr:MULTISPECIES: hypothetical protein [Paenibacillus]MBY0204619.1 hypothetical protein [Paenibacillus cucumis (ex Kampfer et al. 2016)]
MKNPKLAYRLIFFNIIYGLTLVAYPYALMISLFFYGYRESGDHPLLDTIAAILMATYPMGVLFSFVCWAFYHSGKSKWAVATANLFLVWLGAFLIVLLLSDSLF